MALTSHQLAVGMFNMAAGGFESVVTDYMAANGLSATADLLLPYTSLNPQFMSTNLYSNADFATNLVGYLAGGASTTVKASVSTIVKNFMDGNPTLSRGAVTAAVIEAMLAIPTTDSALGSSVTAFNTKVAASVAYTGGSTDQTTLMGVVGQTPVSTGQTFTLTASTNTTTGGIDNVAGTTGNDTVVGVVDTKTATNNTFNAGDQIDGAAGTDTLRLTVVGDGTGTTSSSGAVVQNVEKLEINNSTTGGTYTFDATTVTGLTSAGVTSSISQGTIVSNLSKIIDASMANGKGSLTMSYAAAAVQGSTDTQKVTLNGQTGGTFTADGVETIAVTATGVESKSVTVASNLGTKVTIDGAANLGLTTAIKTVDASALTGKLNLTATNAAAQVTAGAGDDTLNISSLSKDIKVDGGTGTDTLVVGNTTFAADAFTNVSNIETLSLAATANATLDVSKVSGLNTVLAQSKNTTGSVHSITFGSVDNSGDVITLVINGVTVTATENSANVVVGGVTIATGTTITNVATATTAIATAINAATSSLKDVVSAANETNVLKIREKGANAVTVTAAADANVTINGSAAGTTYTIALDTVATSGTLQLDNVAANSTVKLDSSNLNAVAADGSTAQNTALNKMGAVTINVKDATLAANTTDAVTIELNNNNTKAAATTDATKMFNAAQIDAAGVETVTINSIGTYGGNTVADLNIAAAKTINVTGSANLTLSGVEAAATAKLDASAFTGNLTAVFDTTTYTDQVITGGSGNDSVTVTQLTGGDTIDLGAGTDTLNFSAAADVGILNVKNVETIKMTNSGGDTAAMDLRNATGLTKVVVDTGSNNSTVHQLADGMAVQLLNVGANGKGVTLNGATSATTLNISTGSDGTVTSVAGAGFGSTNAQNVTIGTGIKTVNLTVDGASYDTTADADNQIATLSAASLETLAISMSADDGDLLVSTLTASKLTSLTGTGGSGTANNTIIRFSAIDDASSLATIDFSGVAAQVQLGFNGTATFDSFKTKDGASVKTGSGNDTITWDAQNNGANVIDAGSNTTTGQDTLVVYGNLLAPGVADLSSTVDQVSNFNGANSAVQKGFESINLSNVTGAGLTVTGTTGVNTIVGSGQADNITGNGGKDTITGGAGNDSITITDSGATADNSATIVFGTAANNGNDTIAGFKAGAVASGGDVLNFAAFLSGGAVLDADTNGLDVITGSTGNQAAASKVVGLDNGGAAGSVTAATMAGLFKTTDATGNNYFALADNGKAIILHGDKDAALTAVTVYFVDAAADGTGTGVSAADVTIVGTINATDLDTFLAANFAFA